MVSDPSDLVKLMLYLEGYYIDGMPGLLKELMDGTQAEFAALEAQLLAHNENDGDECPLCSLEAENESLRVKCRLLERGHCACAACIREGQDAE